MTEINKYSSPNRFIGRKGNVPDMIVLHNTGGDKISSAHYWFLDPSSEVSAHFLVGQNGEVRQYVSISDAAWCNGTTTDNTKRSWYGNAKSKVVRSRKQNCNLYSISIECVGKCGDTLTPPQLEAVIRLIKYISDEVFAAYGKRLSLDADHIIRHCDVNPKGKPDCGVNIQIDRVLASLKEPAPIIPKPSPIKGNLKFKVNRMM